CRTDYPLEAGIKEKIALFCNVDEENVLQNMDVDILYEVPLALEKERIAQVACKCLKLDCPEPDLTEWQKMCEEWKNPGQSVEVALVGKYTQLHDAYISVVEALKHGGVANSADVSIRWVDSELLNDDNVAERLKGVSGIILPGGFGNRGIEGMITSVKYARENNIPFLGICLGMQISLIEFARNVLGLKDADSTELNPDTRHPVIHLMPDQADIDDIGGTLRLGSYPCILDKDSKAYKLYGSEEIHERHRHRYEVNNDYRDELTSHGYVLSGLSPNGHIVEMIEIKDHPWFIATQAHPELKSRPNRPHPLFKGFIAAACNYNDQ
ncbi:MAG: CTP synthase, partial [Clostridiales bacterium]|nr:CTP synthase [Clostridiales bacterium]